MSEMIKPCPFCKPGTCTPIYDEIYHAVSTDCITSIAYGKFQQRPIEDALNKRIAELEAAERWIPVEERLPDDHTVVVGIDFRYGTLWDAITCHYNDEHEAWYGEWSGLVIDDITHWRPIPQPPE